MYSPLKELLNGRQTLAHKNDDFLLKQYRGLKKGTPTPLSSL